MTERDVRELRRKVGIRPVYKLVDTCAAEFEAFTPYLYSTYERPFQRVGGQKPMVKAVAAECESNPTDRQKVVILGSGPNRIGQGIGV